MSSAGEGRGSSALTEPFRGAEFRAVFEAAPDGCLIVTQEGAIVAVNDEAQRLFGYDRSELLGMSIEALVPRSSKQRHEGLREAYAADPERRPMGIGRELFAQRRDGTVVPVEVGLSPIETGGERYILAVVHDITERRRLRAFGSGVLQGAEEERQRIARDLHDDTAQSLAALVLRLQMARRSTDEETRERLLSELHEELHRASDGVRRILRGLRPPLLEESGLAAALRSHVRSVAQESRLEISVRVADVETELTREEKLALYRIIQEALTNVTRHASATTASVELAVRDEWIVLAVEDDGIGFDAGRPESSHGRGLGIVGMLERAAIIGGVARVESTPGSGTRVTVRLPLKRPAE